MLIHAIDQMRWRANATSASRGTPRFEQERMAERSHMRCPFPKHEGARRLTIEQFPVRNDGTGQRHALCLACLHTFGAEASLVAERFVPPPSLPPGALREGNFTLLMQTGFNILQQGARQIGAGGSCMAPGNRFLLLGLAMTLEAKDILELGYDEGTTTAILALTGARVVALDNLSEYPETEARAREKFAMFPNIEAYIYHALEYLRSCDDNSFDLIFVDDSHNRDHVHQEALEVSRVLRHGGVAAFHDTKYHHIWDVMERAFPRDWYRLHLPSIQVREDMFGADFGLGLIQKPF